MLACISSSSNGSFFFFFFFYWSFQQLLSFSVTGKTYYSSFPSTAWTSCLPVTVVCLFPFSCLMRMRSVQKDYSMRVWHQWRVLTAVFKQKWLTLCSISTLPFPQLKRRTSGTHCVSLRTQKKKKTMSGNEQVSMHLTHWRHRYLGKLPDYLYFQTDMDGCVIFHHHSRLLAPKPFETWQVSMYQTTDIKPVGVS